MAVMSFRAPRHRDELSDLQPLGLRLMRRDSLNIWLRPGREANAAQKNVFIEREGGRETLDRDEGRERGRKCFHGSVRKWVECQQVVMSSVNNQRQSCFVSVWTLSL